MPTSKSLAQIAAMYVVNPNDPTPVFTQLHERVVAALTEGKLTAGQQLPTVRALAETLNLAPNTVAKAYKSLEADGVIVGKGRAGTFVRLTADPLEAAAQQIALDAATAFTRLGIAPDAALAQVKQALRAVSEP